ncbi:cupin domain-containing protein [uncultured Sphaerochaeta sp.]|jgi:quercetin dioxygenase-like cupin family protein|uniref:cupin domain-containing protein n=1 Tax=uncultured Sphaerochaeta sp. TaxID=886478 RepID=UPI002A0A7A9D|nr:cupin domain-containing protein [uncultured Sphaerochaeta sp.]
MILSRTAAEAVLSTTGSGNKVRWLVSKEDGSTNYEMREIRIPPGGKSSNGSHEHEHVVYVLQGKGRVVGPKEEKILLSGTSVFVPGGDEHQWVNDSREEDLVFLCVIPSGSEDFLK